MWKDRFVPGCALVLVAAGLVGLVLWNWPTDGQDKNDPNARLDALMDSLSPELGQDKEQWPSPGDTDSDAALPPLSRTESEKRFQQAADLMAKGDLEQAWELLAGARFDVQSPQALRQLRTELLAQRLHRDGVSPLAARLAAQALQGNPQSGAADVRRELRDTGAWAWEYKGAVDVGSLPAQGDGKPPALFRLQGYTNRSAPKHLGKTRQPVQLHVYPFFLAEGKKQLLGTYEVGSEDLGGERVYTLNRNLGGRKDVLQVYDVKPSYSQGLDDVRRRLDPNLPPEQKTANAAPNPNQPPRWDRAAFEQKAAVDVQSKQKSDTAWLERVKTDVDHREQQQEMKQPEAATLRQLTQEAQRFLPASQLAETAVAHHYAEFRSAQGEQVGHAREQLVRAFKTRQWTRATLSNVAAVTGVAQTSPLTSSNQTPPRGNEPTPKPQPTPWHKRHPVTGGQAFKQAEAILAALKKVNGPRLEQDTAPTQRPGTQSEAAMNQLNQLWDGHNNPAGTGASAQRQQAEQRLHQLAEQQPVVHVQASSGHANAEAAAQARMTQVAALQTRWAELGNRINAHNAVVKDHDAQVRDLDRRIREHNGRRPVPPPPPHTRSVVDDYNRVVANYNAARDQLNAERASRNANANALTANAQALNAERDSLQQQLRSIQ